MCIRDRYTVPWTHAAHRRKRQFDRVSRFSRIYDRFERTDGQTDRTDTEREQSSYDAIIRHKNQSFVSVVNSVQPTAVASSSCRTSGFVCNTLDVTRGSLSRRYPWQVLLSNGSSSRTPLRCIISSTQCAVLVRW